MTLNSFTIERQNTFFKLRKEAIGHRVAFTSALKRGVYRGKSTPVYSFGNENMTLPLFYNELVPIGMGAGFSFAGKQKTAYERCALFLVFIIWAMLK